MRNRARVTTTALAALTALVLAACGGTDPDTDTDAGADPGTPTETATEAAPTATATAEPAGDTTTVATADSDLGTILVDGEGLTLYVFDNDTDGTSSCYDDCATNWPPLTGEAEASGDVDAALLGTTERDDGTVQVTYGGSPLYYFAADAAPGDVNGQGVGDIWWVVAPDGTKVTGDASAAGAEEMDAGY